MASPRHKEFSLTLKHCFLLWKTKAVKITPDTWMSQITLVNILELLMSCFLFLWQPPSWDRPNIMWDKKVLVFCEERFQLLVPTQCSGMIKHTSIFFCFFIDSAYMSRVTSAFCLFCFCFWPNDGSDYPVNWWQWGQPAMVSYRLITSQQCCYRSQPAMLSLPEITHPISCS